MAGKTYTWKSPSVLGNVVLAVMVLNLAILSVSILVGATYGAAAFYTGDEETPTDPQLLRAFLDLLTGIGLLACLVIPFWIVRVSKNARSFKRDLRISPWGGIGWYLVPIMCLFKPYEAMTEIWRASEITPAKTQDHLLILWWVSFLFSGMLSSVALIIQRSEPAPALQIGDDVMGLIAGLIFMTLVWRLTRLQTRKHAAWVEAGAPGQPKPGPLEAVAG